MYRMFLIDWIWSFLFSLGFFQKNATVLVLGLDNAGKTTLIHKLKYGQVKLFAPTWRPQAEDLILGNVKLRAWDLGGHLEARKLWQDYFFEADAVIFMVDAADKKRLKEAKEELHSLLDDESLEESAVAIFCNKSDLETALSREEMAGELEIGLAELSSEEGRPMEMFSTSIVDGGGIREAFDWLSRVL